MIRHSLLSIICLMAAPICLLAQPPKMDVMELGNRMEELVFQLRSDLIPERDKAEAEIIDFGVQSLTFLPALDDGMSVDLRDRLYRIRTTLEKQVVVALSQPSQVTLQGRVSIQDALQQIIQQTGNQIDFPEGELPGLDAIDVNWSGTEFWTAIDEIEQKAPLRLDRYGGRAGLIKLSYFPKQEPLDPQLVLESTPPTVYCNSLRLQVTRMNTTKNLLQPDQSNTGVEMNVRWEPRLRPLAIDLPYSSLRMVDNFDVETLLSDSPRVTSQVVQPEIPEIEVNLRLPLLERRVTHLKSLSGKFQLVLAGREEEFEFADVLNVPGDYALTKAAATVTFLGIERHDQLYGMNLRLSFDEDNNALESHRSWAYQNPVFLRTESGEIITPIGQETFQQDRAALGIQHFFIEVPPKSTLVYRSPSAIIKVEVPFEFRDLILP